MFSSKGVYHARLTLGVVACCIVLMFGHVSAQSSSSQLSVKPDRCIALHQGQICYANLVFQWHTPETGEYCLFDDRVSDPLTCWTGDEKVKYKHEFAADKNVVYDIRARSDQQSLSQTLVKISWVYKSNKKSNSRWRLF